MDEAQTVPLLHAFARLLKAAFSGKGFLLIVYEIETSSTATHIYDQDRDLTLEVAERFVEKQKKLQAEDRQKNSQ